MIILIPTITEKNGQACSWEHNEPRSRCRSSICSRTCALQYSRTIFFNILHYPSITLQYPTIFYKIIHNHMFIYELYSLCRSSICSRIYPTTTYIQSTYILQYSLLFYKVIFNWKVNGIKIDRERAQNFFFADGQGNQSKTEFFYSSVRYSETMRDIGMGNKRSNDLYA